MPQPDHYKTLGVAGVHQVPHTAKAAPGDEAGHERGLPVARWTPYPRDRLVAREPQLTLEAGPRHRTGDTRPGRLRKRHRGSARILEPANR